MFDLLLALPPERFAAFMAGALVVNLAPGQDMIFATACGIQGGPRVGALAGLGAGAGVLWHIALAALGVSALIVAHPGALEVVRWIGAAYLLYLAIGAWRAAGNLATGRGVPSGFHAFRRGILSNIMNPKPVLFILAFLPQFVDPAAGPIWRQVVALGLVFAFSGTLVTMGYGLIAGYAGRALAARMGAVNKLAAALFLGLAAKLAMD